MTHPERPAAEFSSIQAAHDSLPASGGTLILPEGPTQVTSTFLVTKPLALRGVGHGAPIGGGVNITWNPASQLVWSGGPSGPVIAIGDGTKPIGGVSLEGFGIDCAGATHGIDAQWTQASVFRRLGIRNFTGDGIRLRCPSPQPHANTTGNLFETIWLSAHSTSTGALIRADGNSVHTANVCHNTFVRIFGRYYGDGIVFEDTDNNDMFGVFLARVAGVGYGVKFGARARSNYVYHLEAGAGGLYAAAPAVVADPPKANGVFGYDRDNAQPLPVVEPPGTQLEWTDIGSRSTGGWQRAVRVADLIADRVQFAALDPTLRPTVTGRRKNGTAVASLLAALDQLGLIDDATDP